MVYCVKRQPLLTKVKLHFGGERRKFFILQSYNILQFLYSEIGFRASAP
jgi:hypothetical protein